MPVTFINSGQKTYVESSPEGMKTTKLKPAVYSIEFSREEGFYLLNIAEVYKLPVKLYGNYEKAAKRVIKTHFDKEGNTGILLTGLKGTGKSVFVKIVANEMMKLGLPVIQINKAFNGEDLFNFVENIGACVLLFDEFGKNYSCYNTTSQPTQVSLLSLLDGLSNNKRLHLFTENNKEDISQYLINRPGRIHYHFNYNRLTSEVIREYCKDNDIPDNVIDELIGLSGKIRVLSFDVVKCIIEEWKRYGGTIEEHLPILNITMMGDKASKDIEIISIKDKQEKNLVTDTTTAYFRGDRIYIDNILRTEAENTDKQGYWNNGSNADNDTVEMEKLIEVVDDVYSFTSVKGNTVKLKINKPLNEN